MNDQTLSRRSVLAATAGLATGLSLLPHQSLAAKPKIPLGKAEHCIHIWLGGGAGQIDTWDPKRLGNPKKRTPGSYYPAISTAVKNVKVCKHLSRCANILDRFTLFRTVNHNVIDEHAAATNRMHTGRPTSGTIQYPSLGSIVAHEKGDRDASIPPYVVIGYPNLTRGPGFLGAKHGYLYLTNTVTGPAALARSKKISQDRQNRRDRLLQKLRRDFVEKNKRDKVIAEYDQTAQRAYKLAGPKFMNVFQLDKEPQSLRQSYGEEFGRRCLLARRLVQRGVKFIEVSNNLNFKNGTGWDVHNQGIENQHLLIDELDRAVSTLILDLEKHKLLDKTLIVISTEFGRPAGFDGGGGRGHHSKAFSVAMAGGGLKTGTVVGQTDALGMKILSESVPVPNLFATILATLGLNPSKELHDGDRPVPITDMGKPVVRLFT